MWKPGESGNPNGRPPKEKAISNLIREKINGAKFVEILLDKAYEGDMTAIREILNRLEGKPIEQLNVGGVDGEPLKWEISIKEIDNGWKNSDLFMDIGDYRYNCVYDFISLVLKHFGNSDWNRTK